MVTFEGRDLPRPVAGVRHKESTMNYQRFFEDAIDQLHAERRYRVFADLERIVG
ncbi:5-aminolevulinate synthase, partial [Mesorhizobium sp. VK2B]|nr:5-aminolevulinate synthase [Mesorhizobium sp. VK2B]